MFKLWHLRKNVANHQHKHVHTSNTLKIIFNILSIKILYKTEKKNKLETLTEIKPNLQPKQREIKHKPKKLKKNY